MRKMARKLQLPFIWLFVFGWLLAGCSVKPPEEEINQAEAALDSARLAEAPEYASDEYNLAAEMLHKAKMEVDSGEYSSAKNFALTSVEKARGAVAKAASNKNKMQAAVKDSLAEIYLTLDSAKAGLQVVQKKKRLSSKALKAYQEELQAAAQSMETLEGEIDRGELSRARQELDPLRTALIQVRHKLEQELAVHKTIKGRKPQKRG